MMTVREDLIAAKAAYVAQGTQYGIARAIATATNSDIDRPAPRFTDCWRALSAAAPSSLRSSQIYEATLTQFDRAIADQPQP